MVDHATGIRVSVLVSGLLSCGGSFCLFVLLLTWLHSLLVIHEAGSKNTVIRSTLCRFLLHLSVCDFFTALSYVASFFVTTFEVRWYCITEASIMVIFEYASLLWTCSIDKWDREEIGTAVKNLKLTEVFCTIVCWLGPLGLVVVLGATDVLGNKKDGYWCWITDVTDQGWWLQLLCFYFPLWCIILFCLTMLVLHYKNFRTYRNILKLVLMEKEPDFLERCTSFEKEEIDQRVEDFRRSRSLIVWFVISFMFLWLWVSVTYVLDLFNMQVYFLEILKYLCAPLQGFVNFIIYGVVYLDFPFCAYKGWRRYYYMDIPNSRM